MASDDELNVVCSDEEMNEYQGGNAAGCAWHPAPEEIVQLYNTINEKGILELDWKCPGRRSPSPPTEDVDSSQDKSTNEEQDKPATEFDFDDLFSENVTTKITPRRNTPGSAKLKGSGQKRVASFQNVMFDIRRQIRLDKMDQTPTRSGGAPRGRRLPLPPKNSERSGTNTSQND